MIHAAGTRSSPRRLGTLPRVTAAALLTLALPACGGGASEEDVQNAVADALASQKATSPAPSLAEPAPTAAALTTAPTPATVEPSPTPALVDFAMPDLVGSNLQDAQDAIQTLGVFFSVSHDLLGSRSQVLDSNWQVCDQSPAPGTPIKGPAADYEGKIDLGAVKLNENCP